MVLLQTMLSDNAEAERMADSVVEEYTEWLEGETQ
jgi:hypothetical protein